MTYKPIKIIARNTAETGFQKIEQRIKKSIPRPKEISIPRDIALMIGGGIIQVLRNQESEAKISFAGSIRREQENVHDIDILISPYVENMRKTISEIGETILTGPEKISIIFKMNNPLDTKIQVDFRFIAPEYWGPALQYFTGSREHNISLRRIAKERGLSLNEKGLWDNVGNRIDNGSEGSIYRSLGLRWLPPKYRNGYIGRINKPMYEPKLRWCVDHQKKDSCVRERIIKRKTEGTA